MGAKRKRKSEKVKRKSMFEQKNRGWEFMV